MKLEKRNIYGQTCAVFYIKAEDKQFYMSETLTVDNVDTHIVLVDRHRFESAWFKDGEHSHLSRGSINSWRNDHKFNDMKHVFDGGIENPVPLALMRAEEQPKSVGFTDGVTRTIWLIANGAKYFPVKVYGAKAAYRLHQRIGVTSTRPIAKKGLLSLLQNHSEIQL
ncbi:plasmid fertility inhibition factor family protein [Vibrio jasicida]|uniref:plasmid fertility inhibition factor family protein n=1 Tax=Vibrio jasicida TaxID=766224 RepID=UPI000CE39E69|nr:hypothetical protein [Vibrio jasicida]